MSPKQAKSLSCGALLTACDLRELPLPGAHFPAPESASTLNTFADPVADALVGCAIGTIRTATGACNQRSSPSTSKGWLRPPARGAVRLCRDSESTSSRLPSRTISTRAPSASGFRTRPGIVSSSASPRVRNAPSISSTATVCRRRCSCPGISPTPCPTSCAKWRAGGMRSPAAGTHIATSGTSAPRPSGSTSRGRGISSSR